MNKLRHLIGLILVSFQVVVCLALAQTSPAKPDSNFTHLIHVSVSDEKNQRVINGLPKEAFTIFYGDEKQEIAFFGEQDTPASIAVLVDASGSMKEHAETVKKICTLLLKFIEQSNPANNYFVVNLQEQTRFLTDLTKDVATIGKALNESIAAPQGNSRLFDALYEVLEKMKQNDSLNRKRAILLISDGIDNSSKHKFQDIKHAFSQSDVIVYVLGTINNYSIAAIAGGGQDMFTQLSQISGGRTRYPHPSKINDTIFADIDFDLKHQYTLGFTPTITDGKYHKIKVTLSPENARELLLKEPSLKDVKLKARTREGYQ